MPVEKVETDILVIGGGLAGAFAAIKAKEAGARKVTVVSKGKLGKDSVATFGAGVYAMFLPHDDRDRMFKHCALHETLGDGLCNEEWLNVFFDENYDRILDMERWGVKFEKTPDGNYRRIEARWKFLVGMFQGPKLMEVLAKKVIDSGVEVIPRIMITDLLTVNGEMGGGVVGAVGFDGRTGEFKAFKAKATIIAAGACSMKARFTGQKFETGDTYAMAYRAGAKLGGLELGHLMQTTCTDFDTQGLNMFVGLGGQFIYHEGESFLLDYDPELGNHTSMARLSEASAMEVRAGRGPIYLDMTFFTPEKMKLFKTALPLPTMIMERAGVIVGDRIVKKMEWAPAWRGLIAQGGGVVVNTKCEASLPGLYACGDAMERHKHPPLGLPGASVTGARAGRFAAQYVKDAPEPKIDEGQLTRLKRFAVAPLKRKSGFDPDHIIIGLQEVLLPYEVTVISRGDRLERAIREVERIGDEEVPLLYATDPHCLRVANETENMVLFAELYLRSRLLRKESRDACVREDYPYTDNINWRKWTVLKQEEGRIKIWTEDVPKGRIEPKREKYLYPVFEVATRRGVKWG